MVSCISLSFLSVFMGHYLSDNVDIGISKILLMLATIRGVAILPTRIL